MTTTFSNRGYALQGTGDNPNAWGSDLNENFSTIDNNISSETSITTTGGTTTLTSTQAQALVYSFGGNLTSQATIVFPFDQMFFFAFNNTNGAFPVVIKAAGGGVTQTVGAGTGGVYWSDSTNITLVSTNINPVPSGTVLGSFIQASAPVGWTQVTSINDCTMRLISGAGGGTTGGSWAITGATIAGTAISVAQMPAHNHAVSLPTGTALGVSSGGNGSTSANVNTFTTTSSGNGQAHTHTWSNDGTWRPLYINVIACRKN
jgi:hypothetical protein